MADFVVRRTKQAEGKIAFAEAQAAADVRAAAVPVVETYDVLRPNTFLQLLYDLSVHKLEVIEVPLRLSYLSSSRAKYTGNCIRKDTLIRSI